MRYRQAGIRRALGQTRLSSETLAQERRLLAAGFKGWTIGVTYKDGSTEQIPIVARSYQEALRMARPKMNQVSSQVYEIVIVDPSLGEILHKVGAGAARVAKSIGRGVYRVAKGAATVAGKAIKAGVVGAAKLSEEIKDVRAEAEAAREGRPFGGESPLTVSKAEKVAQEVVLAQESAELGEEMPAWRRRKTRVCVEVE